MRIFQFTRLLIVFPWVNRDCRDLPYYGLYSSIMHIAYFAEKETMESSISIYGHSLSLKILKDQTTLTSVLLGVSLKWSVCCYRDNIASLRHTSLNAYAQWQNQRLHHQIKEFPFTLLPSSSQVAWETYANHITEKMLCTKQRDSQIPNWPREEVTQAQKDGSCWWAKKRGLEISSRELNLQAPKLSEVCAWCYPGCGIS